MSHADVLFPELEEVAVLFADQQAYAFHLISESDGYFARGPGAYVNGDELKDLLEQLDSLLGVCQKSRDSFAVSVRAFEQFEDEVGLQYDSHEEDQDGDAVSEIVEEED